MEKGIAMEREVTPVGPKVLAAIPIALALELVLWFALSRMPRHPIAIFMAYLVFFLPSLVCSIPGLWLLFRKEWLRGSVAVAVGALLGVGIVFIAAAMAWSMAPALVRK